MLRRTRLISFTLALCGLGLPLLAANTFRVATYNVEGYLTEPAGTRPAKSSASKAKVREHIRELNADVLALQEIGSAEALNDLRQSLKSEGLDYPHWELVRGYDTNIHVAVLSRFDITGRRPHTTESYLLHGRRFRVTRGFAEVDIRVNQRYSFTLLAAHLKSRRASSVADESEMRLQEARLLREIIDARLAANPSTNILVAGDLNDVKSSASVRWLLGRGKGRLTDTRPSERTNSAQAASELGLRTITWTHFFSEEDVYSRVDYILLSPGMAREWLSGESWVLGLPGWGVASDHRPVIVAFETPDQ